VPLTHVVNAVDRRLREGGTGGDADEHADGDADLSGPHGHPGPLLAGSTTGGAR
jgi:hypothetical protein